MSLNLFWTTAMLSTIFTLLVCAVLYSTRIIGYTIGARRIGLFTIDELSLICTRSHSFTVAIRKVTFSFNIPSSKASHWLIITADNYQYKDNDCFVSLDKATVTHWIFPVLFRQTAGPWITTILDGFSVQIFTSEKTPRWIQRLRNNIIYTTLDGDTIRLDDFKTKIQFSTPTGSEDAYDGDVEKPGLEAGESYDEMVVKFTASQWHILNVRRRMYTYGDLVGTLRRNWVENTGSLVMIGKESKWTKMPALADQGTYRKQSVLWQVLEGFFYFPSEIVKICKDPLSTVDIVVPTCEINFESFRLRDAQLLKHGVLKMRREYQAINDTHPGLVQDMLWDFTLYSFLKALA